MTLVRTLEVHVLQHRDKTPPGQKWVDHCCEIFKIDLMPEIYHLSDTGTTGKEYRVIRRTETELMRFTGLRDIVGHLEAQP